jgi:hypothetical protein
LNVYQQTMAAARVVLISHSLLLGRRNVVSWRQKRWVIPSTLGCCCEDPPLLQRALLHRRRSVETSGGIRSQIKSRENSNNNEDDLLVRKIRPVPTSPRQDKFDKIWNRNFEKVQAHFREMAQTQQHPLDDNDDDEQVVSSSYSTDRYDKELPLPLKVWLNKQRYLYLKKRQCDEEDNNAGNKTNETYVAMSDERQAKLETLNISLVWFRDIFWHKRYQQLVEFVRRSDGSFPYDCDREQLPDEGMKLFWWCIKQKKCYRERHQEGVNRESRNATTSMTPERESLLNEIGFCWNHNKASWDARFNELKAYNEQHGDCLVPLHYPANPTFAKWVAEQRANSTSSTKSEKKAAISRDHAA